MATGIEITTEDGKGEKDATIVKKKGATLKLKAKVTPENASQTVKWSIKTGGSMAEIDGNGILK